MSKTIEAQLSLRIGKHNTKFKVVVSAANTDSSDVLPFARALSDRTIAVAIEEANSKGQSVSCRKGCSACCYQLVPVSETEAHDIAKYIKSLPKSRRQQLKVRFEEAKNQLENTDLWRILMHPQRLDLHRGTGLSLRYLEQNIPCPFLDDNSACTIHAQRPLSCREYLVTSDPQHCSDPGAEKIIGVEIPSKVSHAMASLHEGDPNYHSSWVPLIAVPYWREEYPGFPAKRPGPQWVETLLTKIGAATE